MLALYSSYKCICCVQRLREFRKCLLRKEGSGVKCKRIGSSYLDIICKQTDSYSWNYLRPHTLLVCRVLYHSCRSGVILSVLSFSFTLERIPPLTSHAEQRLLNKKIYLQVPACMQSLHTIQMMAILYIAKIM